MRFTFTNEVVRDFPATPRALFQMWRMEGFWLWEKQSFYGTVSFYESDLEGLYIFFSSDENNKYYGGVYNQERIDMNEFLKGYKAIQAYRELNSV